MFELIKTYQVRNTTGYIYTINGRKAATFAKSLDALKQELGVAEQRREWLAVMSKAAQVVELPVYINRELVVSAIEEIDTLNLTGPDFDCLDHAPRNCTGLTDAKTWSDFHDQINNMAYWCTRFTADFHLYGANEILRLTHHSR